MEWLTVFFNNPNTPWVIAGGLVVVTAFSMAGWWWRGNSLKKSLDEIQSILGISPEFLQLDDEERWHQFASYRIEDAKLNLRKDADSGPLTEQVRTFLDSCQPVIVESFARFRLETATHPRDVLSISDYLLGSCVQVGLYKSFPNYLVGAGLCITFLGLAVVIGNAGHVLDSGDAQNAKIASDALRDLLTAASSKFWSSLAAVALSILYGIFFRMRSQWMDFRLGLLAKHQCR